MTGGEGATHARAYRAGEREREREEQDPVAIKRRKLLAQPVHPV